MKKLLAALAVCSLTSLTSCGDSATPPAPGPQQPGTAAPTPTSSMPGPNPSPGASPSSTPQFKTGSYGGENILFTQKHNASETVSIACAPGEIPIALNVDSYGNFNGLGTIKPSRGAEPQGGYPTYTASYYGTIHGDDLTLYATYRDGAGNTVALGPYHATYGQIGSITDGCL